MYTKGLFKTIPFGKTGMVVSRLCFGTEPFTVQKGPPKQKAQGDLLPDEGAQILKAALELGVNFWDTSKNYGTHPHVSRALKIVDRKKVVVADKSYAKSADEAKIDLEQSLKTLAIDYVDIMLLHYVKLGELEERNAALEVFSKAKRSGLVRAVGLSTHSTKVLLQAAKMPELDVVCALLNCEGRWIEDDTLSNHVSAIRTVYETGKAVYVMKILSAGYLRAKAELAVRSILKYHPFIHVFNIGMYSVEEVERNIKILEDFSE